MADFPVSFDLALIERTALEYPTPFHLYDEAMIRARAQKIYSAMRRAGVPGFTNYFAVKALPNPHIMEILKQEGMGADCSSLAELELAARIGLQGDEIMFSSNNTSIAEFTRAHELKAIINFDDISLIDPYLDQVGIPAMACCRFNPGDIEFDGVNEAIIGKPSEAKYGMTKAHIIEAYTKLKAAGVTRFGLHTMLLSNELDWRNHQKIADLIFTLAHDIHDATGIVFESINLGGGIGVAYKPEQTPFDLDGFAGAIAEMYKTHDLEKLGNPRIVMENGRYITAEAGYLVTKIVNRKDTHKVYLGVDASMSNLMRPGMYGAYHHITVLGKEDEPTKETADIVGSLCENNDKFAIDRGLPHTEIGDYIVIHTTGAHGHAMGFQYNGKLRSAELLLKPDKSIQLIRRAETLEDYFATLV